MAAAASTTVLACPDRKAHTLTVTSAAQGSSGFSLLFFLSGALRSLNILQVPHLSLPVLFCVHLYLVFLEERVLVECLRDRLGGI